MPRNRPLVVFLVILALFLVILALFLIGTVVVLSSTAYYLAISPDAYLSELELPQLRPHERWNASAHGQVERIARIIHQTWKTDVLPQRWRGISQECRDMMPDYEYMLWTDQGSRDFIAENYPWFLDTFDGYKYNIQRADAIRYFVLYHYGGVYIDLDIGCLRPLDPLLTFPAILPKTIPVGVSNDLMFAEKHHPFLAQTIHNLATFDHSWILNYPTVMFSTGPMFLSAQYGIYTSHANAVNAPVRILPKSLYGKNAKEGEAPHSFFSHFYGSSWHADDAAFIGFLGTWGTWLMRIGAVILIVGVIAIILPARKRRGLRRSGYEVLFPRWSPRTGRWTFHLGRTFGSGSSSSSPSESLPQSPLEPNVPVLQLPFDVQPSSPVLSETSAADHFPSAGSGGTGNPLLDAYDRLRRRVATMAGVREEIPRTPIRPRRHRQRGGILFFLPAIFTQTQDVELGPTGSESHPPGIFAGVVPAAVPTLSRPPSRVPEEKTRAYDESEPSVERQRLLDDTQGADGWPEAFESRATVTDRAWGNVPRTRSSSHIQEMS